jgi:protocatechuate 3,4-dioxygenase, beta subunit
VRPFGGCTSGGLACFTARIIAGGMEREARAVLQSATMPHGPEVFDMLNPTRRRFTRVLAAATAAHIALPAWAQSTRPLARMTDGPFYPPAAWRANWGDEDADLTQVRRDGKVFTARGEPLQLVAEVADTRGRRIDAATVEIWQCDSLGHYRHPNVAAEPGRFDPGFQGFGMARSNGDGFVQLRTIKPVPYPGRTPHIHLKLRHASFGELTTQLFVAGEPGNARDFLWRSLRAEDRTALEMSLLPAGIQNRRAGEDGGSGTRWATQVLLTVPA